MNRGFGDKKYLFIEKYNEWQKIFNILLDPMKKLKKKTSQKMFGKNIYKYLKKKRQKKKKGILKTSTQKKTLWKNNPATRGKKNEFTKTRFNRKVQGIENTKKTSSKKTFKNDRRNSSLYPGGLISNFERCVKRPTRHEKRWVIWETNKLI